MRKIIATAWMSLDGIFDSGSMEQWFNPYHSDIRAKYIQDTIHNCEIMLYGRVTYEMLYPYWSALKNNEMGVADKLNKVKKYVVSTKMKHANWENSSIIKQNMIQEIRSLKQQAGGNILVQGSATLLKSLLGAGLVDELKLLVHPYIAGEGERLFSGKMDHALEFVNCRPIEKGVLILDYRPTID